MDSSTRGMEWHHTERGSRRTRRGDDAIIEAKKRQCRGEGQEIETVVLFLSFFFSCSKYQAARQAGKVGCR